MFRSGKTMLRMTLREIKKEKLQFFALVILLAMGAGTFNMMLIGYYNIGNTYDLAYGDYHLADRWIQAYQATHETFKVQDVIDVLNQVEQEFPGAITSREFRHVRDATLNLTTSSGFTLLKVRLVGYNVTGGRMPTVNSLKVIDGRFFTDSDRWSPSNPQVKGLVDVHLKRFYDFSIPMTLQVISERGTTDVQVIGTAGSPEYLLLSAGWNDLLPSPRRFTVLYLPLEAVQHLTGTNPGEINEIILRFKDGMKEDQKDLITERIVGLLEKKGYNLEDPLDRRSWPPYELLRLDYEGFEEMAFAFPLLIYVVALIGVYILMNRKIIAQRKEIGVSRALGYSRASIVWRYASYSVFLGLAGSLLGIVVGIIAGDIFTDSYLDTIGVPFKYHGIYLDILLASVLVSLFFSLIGAVIPSYNSSSVQPAEAMRLDPSVHLTKGGKSLTEKTFEKVGICLPLRFKLTLRSLFRNRRRSWGTIIGLSFSLMLILASLGMYDSLVGTIGTLQERETWDLRIQYDDFKPGSKVLQDIREIKSWDGVADVEPAVIFTTILTSNNSDEELPLQLTVLRSNTTMHDFAFITSNGEFRDDGIVITEPVKKKLGLDIGDQVNVLHPVIQITNVLPLEYTIIMKNSSLTVTGIVNEVNGLNCYLTFDTMKELVKTTGTEANYLYIRTTNKDRQFLEDLKTKIYREIGEVQGVDMVKDLQEDWLDYFALMTFYISILVIFSFIVGLSLVLNTVIINITERKRELATMRTLGDSTKDLILQLNLEHLLLGIISLFIGIPLGYQVIIEMYSLYNVDYFNFIITISGLSFVITIVSLILIVMLAQFKPTRSISKLNLAEATKEIL